MKTNNKSILIVITLDTKSEEAEYVRSLISERGHNPKVMDVGVLGNPSFVPDIENEKVAKAVGMRMEEIISLGDEGKAISLMAQGALNIIRELHSDGEIDGLISLGGSMGTSLGLSIMKDLPINLPKLMVSTIAFTPLVTPDSVSIDQVMMQTVADLWGINCITKMVLERAAGAICGMAEEQKKMTLEKSLVAITTLGSSVHNFADRLKPMLIENGYEPIVFHTVGTNACEKIIREGYIDGLLDFSIFELVNFICGGAIEGGKEKMIAACGNGIPQVVAPGALGWFQWAGAKETLPSKYKNREIRMHNPLTLQVQTSEEEKIEVAKLVASRLNKSKEGSTTILVPLKGFSEMDKMGMPFYDPGGRKRFVEVLKKEIDRHVVEILEVDAHINDEAFAEKAIELLLRKMKK